MSLVVLFGPPGAGKGTQAELIAERTGFIHISTGDILREAVKAGTDYGIMIKSYMNKGELVPDEVVNGAVKEKLDDCKGCSGFIFDGFPRNLEQARDFDRTLDSDGKSIDIVINIDIDYDLLINRITGRRVCGKCSRTYNTELDDLKVNDGCSCGGNIIQRRDDSLEVVNERMKVYTELTEPLIEYYRHKHILKDINGNGSVEQVAAEIMDLL